MIKFNIRKLSQREKWITGITLVFVLVFLGDRLIIKTASRQWRSINQEIESKEMRLLRNLRLISREEELKNTIKKYDELKNKGLSDKQIEGEFLKEIEELARKSKVRITNMKPLPTREEEFFTVYTADIEVDSTMSRMVTFLYTIKKEPNYVKVEKLNIRQPRRSSTTLKIRMILSKISL